MASGQEELATKETDFGYGFKLMKALFKEILLSWPFAFLVLCRIKTTEPLYN